MSEVWDSVLLRVWVRWGLEQRGDSPDAPIYCLVVEGSVMLVAKVRVYFGLGYQGDYGEAVRLLVILVRCPYLVTRTADRVAVLPRDFFVLGVVIFVGGVLCVVVRVGPWDDPTYLAIVGRFLDRLRDSLSVFLEEVVFGELRADSYRRARNKLFEETDDPIFGQRPLHYGLRVQGGTFLVGVRETIFPQVCVRVVGEHRLRLSSARLFRRVVVMCNPRRVDLYRLLLSFLIENGEDLFHLRGDRIAVARAIVDDVRRTQYRIVNGVQSRTVSRPGIVHVFLKDPGVHTSFNRPRGLPVSVRYSFRPGVGVIRSNLVTFR